MAASVYNWADGFSWQQQVASATIGPYKVEGGKYSFGSYDTGTNNATLQLQTPAGNYLTVGTLASSTMAIIDLPRGQYKVVLGAGTTLNDGFLAPIPYRVDD